MFFNFIVTPGGSPAALERDLCREAGQRVAVTVSVAGLPGMYDAASSFAANVKGGFSVTARAMDVSMFFGGSGRLANP